MPICRIVTRDAYETRANSEKVQKALTGLTGQEIANALLLAMVEHIELVAPEHRAELARGVADALIANFSNSSQSP